MRLSVVYEVVVFVKIFDGLAAAVHLGEPAPEVFLSCRGAFGGHEEGIGVMAPEP